MYFTNSYFKIKCYAMFSVLNLLVLVENYLSKKFTTIQTDLNDVNNVSFERESIA